MFNGHEVRDLSTGSSLLIVTGDFLFFLEWKAWYADFLIPEKDGISTDLTSLPTKSAARP